MTNEEWIKSLDTEELQLTLGCTCCKYNNDICIADSTRCKDGRIAWLKQEHRDEI